MVSISKSCSSVCEEEEGERAPSSGPDRQIETRVLLSCRSSDGHQRLL